MADPTPRFLLTSANVTIIGSVLVSIFIAGMAWNNEANNYDKVGKQEASDYKIVTDRMDRADRDRDFRRDTLNAKMEADRRETLARMDQDKQESRARFENDERDTKAAVATVNSIDNRLSRMEAQIDLLVKNVTTSVKK